MYDIIEKMLDKKSYIPYYVQIKHVLLERIRNNEYTDQSLLPSETALSQEFSVTRMTVRKALDELKREGMITTERGKGSRVTTKKIEQSLQRFYRFGKEVGDTGVPAKSRIIERKTCDPPAEISEMFHSQEPFYFFVRVRYFEDTPLSLEHVYIPVSVAPGLIDEPIEMVSIAELLEKKYNIPIIKATEYLTPRIADTYEAEQLELQPATPIFQTERITKSQEGRVIEFRRSVIRGDMVKFSTELF